MPSSGSTRVPFLRWPGRGARSRRASRPSSHEARQHRESPDGRESNGHNEEVRPRFSDETKLILERELTMLSARNQFNGVVKSVKLGGVMAEVVITVGNLEMVSAITRTSAEML